MDGNQELTRYGLDSWGRVEEATAPDGSKETYTYNPAGKITSTTDANENTTTYRYNSFGKVSQIIDQEGESEYYYYDGEQNQILYIDRAGNRVERTYNVDGNLVKQTARGIGGSTETAVYTYNTKGLLSKAINEGFSYQYLYTPDGELLEKSSCGRKLLQNTYNKNGQVTMVRDITGKSSHYSYDIMGRMERISEESGETIASYQYDAKDQLVEVSHRNGMYTKYEYDGEGNVTRLLTGSEEETYLDLVYCYDGNGNRVSKYGIQKWMQEGVLDKIYTTYTYDPKNQLVQENVSGAVTEYGYDKAGNRTHKITAEETVRYTFNQKNQLTMSEGRNGKKYFTYDPQGSILKEEGPAGETQYGYNPLNQQTEVTRQGQRVQVNRYDAEGLRAEMEENGHLVLFLFHKGEVITEQEERGAPATRFLRGYGVEACERRDGRHYYYKDEQLSTWMVTGEDRETEPVPL